MDKSVLDDLDTLMQTKLFMVLDLCLFQVVNGDVIKRVRVTLECSVTYYQSHHRMVNLKLHDVVEHLTGEALVIKKKKSRVASLDCIQNVSLACISGACTLQVTP